MQNEKGTIGEGIGIGILVLAIGMPAKERAGFLVLLGTELNWSLPLYLAVATLGGAVGGALLGGRHYVAGFIGGVLAGPCSFFTVYYYCLQCERVYSIEGIIVQLVGSLPGFALFYLLKREEASDNSADEEFVGSPRVDAPRF